MFFQLIIYFIHHIANVFKFKKKINFAFEASTILHSKSNDHNHVHAVNQWQLRHHFSI